MLGSLILYLKGIRIMMFQLSGFYYNYVTRGDNMFLNARDEKRVGGVPQP